MWWWTKYLMQSLSNKINYFDLHGDVVRVLFLDHATGEATFECEVFGILTDEDEASIRIRYWHCHGMDDDNFNHEHLTIIKGAIISVISLKEAG